MAVSFKGAHFPKEVILMGIRWYVAYPLSTRHVEELMEERGVELDHATINRWVIKYSPQIAERSPQTRAFEAFTHGNRYLAAGQFADATAAFEQARTLDPKRPYVAERLAEVARRQHAASTLAPIAAGG